ncbi:MAG: putative DNA-binding domain-containing protein [Hyphomicrobiales bacterium]|nr:putative DNA-binding domain-containing protein [Hyphomicrobiales bacterium]
MPFDAVIAGFAAALEDSAAPPPATVLGRRGAPDGRRFSIYRNNVAVGLIGALAARYPVTLATLGAETFRDLARVFAQARKPRSPVMIAYGAEFPDFLQEAAPDLAAPGVVEVARLENAWVEAYHAEEAPAATLADLAALEPGRIARARAALHPAARLLRFATPAASLWASRQTEASPSTTLRVVPLPRNAGEDGEDALITRPEADVRVRILPSGGYAFAQALLEGAMLAEAAEALGELEDFGTHLVGLVEAGAFQSILPGDPS